MIMSLLALEVMDKEPGIPGFWISAVVLGGVGYFLARRRWWWAVPILVVLAFSTWGVWSEWTDPVVGPAIAAEAGAWYPYHLIASALLAAGLTLAGVWRARRAG